uniref:Putative chaperone n=1 Tax=viral metagenome TaxID=1070528 RepID=A0A6M3L856_9ZZZZ
MPTLKRPIWNVPIGGWMTCAMCGGNGKWWPRKKCPRCKGRGEVQVKDKEKR